MYTYILHAAFLAILSGFLQDILDTGNCRHSHILLKVNTLPIGSDMNSDMHYTSYVLLF